MESQEPGHKGAAKVYQCWGLSKHGWQDRGAGCFQEHIWATRPVFEGRDAQTLKHLTTATVTAKQHCTIHLRGTREREERGNAEKSSRLLQMPLN